MFATKYGTICGTIFHAIYGTKCCTIFGTISSTISIAVFGHMKPRGLALDTGRVDATPIRTPNVT